MGADESPSSFPSGFPEPPRGLLRMLGLVTKAQHEQALEDQRAQLAGTKGMAADQLTAKTAELATTRAELAARTAELGELRRREGMLIASIQSKEEQAQEFVKAEKATAARLAKLQQSAEELSRRELEDALYVPFSSDYSMRCRSERLALAVGTNTAGSRIGSALYLRLRPHLSVGGSVSYDVQSDVVERLVLGGTLAGGSSSLKLAMERQGAISMLYNVKLTSVMQVALKAQVTEDQSSIRNVGACVTFNI